MNARSTDRFAGAAGLAVAIAVCTWWLGATRLALDHASDPARIAAEALQALALARLGAVALITARATATVPIADSLRAGCLVVVQGWPVVLLAWSASTVTPGRVIVIEGILLLAACLMTIVRAGVQRVVPRHDAAVMIITVAAIALTSGAWLTPALWRMPPG